MTNPIQDFGYLAIGLGVLFAWVMVLVVWDSLTPPKGGRQRPPWDY